MHVLSCDCVSTDPSRGRLLPGVHVSNGSRHLHLTSTRCCVVNNNYQIITKFSEDHTWPVLYKSVMSCVVGMTQSVLMRLIYPYSSRLFQDTLQSDVILGLFSLSGRTFYRKISRSIEDARFGFGIFSITLEFDRRLGSNAAEMPVKFESDTIIITSSHAGSRFGLI